MIRQQKQKKKHEIKENVKWDRKSTRNSILLILGTAIAFLIYINRNNLKELIVKDKYLNTQGKIERFESIQIPYESKLGQRIMTKYRVEYSYNAFGKRYEKSELINENPNKINRIIVVYNVENPRNASLEIE